jgi:hypothetical protein
VARGYVSGSAGEEFPGWEVSDLGTMTLTVVIAGDHITLATVTRDAETGLHRTYIGGPVARNQLGRHDSSQERAVRKAEDFLWRKLRSLLLRSVTFCRCMNSYRRFSETSCLIKVFL